MHCLSAESTHSGSAHQPAYARCQPGIYRHPSRRILCMILTRCLAAALPSEPSLMLSWRPSLLAAHPQSPALSCVPNLNAGLPPSLPRKKRNHYMISNPSKGDTPSLNRKFRSGNVSLLRVEKLSRKRHNLLNAC